MAMRVVQALLLSVLPFAVLVTLALMGGISLDLVTVIEGVFMGLPFWVLVVLPIHLLSGRGRRWSLLMSISVGFITLAAAYIAYLWTPAAHTLEVGGRVLVEKGVVTSAYYKELFADVVVAALSVLLGTPIFARFVRK